MLNRKYKKYEVTDPEQRKFLLKKNALWKASAPQWNPLRNKLLEIEGEFAIFPAVDSMKDIPKLLTRGKLWDIANLRFHKMGRGECHLNSLKIWSKQKQDGCAVATGYALSKDGVWREHSWIVTKEGTQSVIVETTQKRVAYFGYELTRREAQYWLDDLLAPVANRSFSDAVCCRT